MTAGRWLGWVTMAGGGLVLVAYAVGLEAIWRPVAHGPATSPLTALLFILSGFAICQIEPMRIPRLSLLLFLGVGTTGLLRILLILLGVNDLNTLGIFERTLAQEAMEGTPISFGWNTAAMFLLVSAAFLLRFLGWSKGSQIAAICAIAFPLIALTGYAYGVQAFHGEMSQTTVLIGLALTASPLLLGARNGLMRPISSPWDGGKFGRRQILIIVSAAFIGGLLFNAFDAPLGSSLFPLFVVISIVIASTTIAYYSVAIERNAFLRRQAERALANMVMTDRLTGFFNHRFLVEQNDGLCAFARREGYQVWVLLLDIDHFTYVNKGFGFPAGDYVIARFADEIRRGLRNADIAIRYEGKNGKRALCVLLNVNAEEAVAVGEKIRENFEDLQLPEIGYRRVTASVGAARVLTNLNEAIGRADEALFMAKNRGRNCVVADRMQPGLRLIEPATIENAPIGDEFYLCE